MDVALKQVEKAILAAIPAYETYFLQMMGKPFRFKPPLFRMNSELLRVKFDSVEQKDGASKTPERLVMFAEYNRAMDSCTITTEYWQDVEEENPTARGEAKVDATSENLMAPAFAFGWLHKLVASKDEGIEGEDMSDETVEGRMEQAELLIVKADELLAEVGFVIEGVDSYESYANTLDSFLLMSSHLDEQVEGVLSKIGGAVRKAASAYGAVKGGAQGLKARWQGFKASVSKSYSDSHKAAHDKWSGKGGGDKKPAQAAPSKEKGAPHLKVVKGGKGARSGGKKMTDKEYKKRYPGKQRKLAAALDIPSNDLAEMMDGLRDEFYEREFNSLSVDGLLTLEELVLLMHEAYEPTTTGGSFDAMKKQSAGGAKASAASAAAKKGFGKDKFQKLASAGKREDVGTPEQVEAKFEVLIGKLKDIGVKNPAALAMWIGRDKYRDDAESESDETSRKNHGAVADSAVSTYQKLSGVSLPMRSWSLPKHD